MDWDIFRDLFRKDLGVRDTSKFKDLALELIPALSPIPPIYALPSCIGAKLQ